MPQCLPLTTSPILGDRCLHQLANPTSNLEDIYQDSNKLIQKNSLGRRGYICANTLLSICPADKKPMVFCIVVFQ